MVMTLSSMIPLGTTAPEFDLFNPATGKSQNLQTLKGEHATVIMFICNHCPFVKHITQELAQLGKDYQSKGIGFIAINSNDVDHYPDDSPENMVLEVQRRGYSFPYLFDETQEIARAYHAECTPDFFIFDQQLRCVYRGQLDGSRPGNGVKVTGEDLREALENILEGKAINPEQIPSVGCNIKWKDR